MLSEMRLEARREALRLLKLSEIQGVLNEVGDFADTRAVQEKILSTEGVLDGQKTFTEGLPIPSGAGRKDVRELFLEAEEMMVASPDFFSHVFTNVSIGGVEDVPIKCYFKILKDGSGFDMLLVSTRVQTND